MGADHHHRRRPVAWTGPYQPTRDTSPYRSGVVIPGRSDQEEETFPREPHHHDDDSGGMKMAKIRRWPAFLGTIREEDAENGCALHLRPKVGPAMGGQPSAIQVEMDSLYFQTMRKRIDFVLAYEDGDALQEERRKIFEANLRQEGLLIEVEDKAVSQDGKTYFLKLHAPWAIVAKHAEFLNMKMPIVDSRRNRTESPIERRNSRQPSTCTPVHLHCPPLSRLSNTISSSHGRVLDESRPIAWVDPSQGRVDIDDDIFKIICCFGAETTFMYNKEVIPDEPHLLKTSFSRQWEKQPSDPRTSFVGQDHERYFTYAQRSRIVWEILIRTPYEPNDSQATTGIIHLISHGTYKAGYPLHDGPYGKGSYKQEDDTKNERRLLYSEWARPACWYKRQPLHLISRYFGEKTGLYFAWLGFYTYMLIPPAGLGLFTMFYGLATMHTNVPSQEICDMKGAGGVIMCPLCDRKCDYWYLADGCMFSKVIHLFDNPATVGFAVFMSLWATMFMELWKRKQARLAWEWDLADYDHDQEIIRPEYESSVFTYRLNPVTMAFEPYLSLWQKLGRMIGSNSVVLFMLSLVLAAVFGIIVYRIAIVATLYASDKIIWRTNAKLITSSTAALLNLLIIIIMDKVYRVLATVLTNVEQPRTQREYEDSFTFKMFLFEFINMYSSLIYIAFFKGRFFGHPGDAITLFGFRQDQCELGGCLFEVCIQLAIIMVGKQIMNNITELFYTKIMNWWREWWRAHEGPRREATTRWELDYNLQECDRLALFDEYLEMVIQYGFVTLFVAAFPLAPLFALLNNIVEIRLDAYKYVTQLRRPVSARVPNIGAWQTIIHSISIFAVISNAFMIAYTSDFIPRLVYMYVYSEHGTLWGYINNSLSYFNTSDFPLQVMPENKSIGNIPVVKVCRYQDYRLPPEHERKYNLTMEYWHIFAARLSFVVVFEHLVFFITGLLAYLIPDIPSSVKQKMLRQRFLAREALNRIELEENRRTLMDMGLMSSSNGGGNV